MPGDELTGRLALGSRSTRLAEGGVVMLENDSGDVLTLTLKRNNRHGFLIDDNDGHICALWLSDTTLADTKGDGGSIRELLEYVTKEAPQSVSASKLIPQIEDCFAKGNWTSLKCGDSMGGGHLILAHCLSTGHAAHVNASSGSWKEIRTADTPIFTARSRSQSWWKL